MNLIVPLAILMISISLGLERSVDNSGFKALTMLYLGLIFILNVQIAIGAYCMLTPENYESARWAAGLNCRPLLVPGCLVELRSGLSPEEAIGLFADQE